MTEQCKDDETMGHQTHGLNGLLCNEPTCFEPAGVDGWCCNHSSQLKKFGTHFCVGSQGPR